MKVLRTLCVSVALLSMGACDRLQSMITPPPPLDGASLIIEIDAAAAANKQLEELSDQMADTLRVAGVRYTGRGVLDGAVRIRLIDPAELDEALAALAPITGHLNVTTTPEGMIEGRYKEEYASQAVAALTEQAMPIIERRLHGLRAAVEAHAPGQLRIRTSDPVVPDMVKYVVGQQGVISFHMVREISAEERQSGALPIGTMLVAPYGAGQPEIVQRRPEFTGERLSRANPSTDTQTGEFVLSFALDPEGTQRFCRITREHTGDRFAILFDGMVLTAPMINEPICGGSGQISGNFTAESANELAIMLRAGALPAPFRVQRPRLSSSTSTSLARSG